MLTKRNIHVAKLILPKIPESASFVVKACESISIVRTCENEDTAAMEM
jgi:hypothetical protein